jgi:UDP-N-acetylmuramate dehydrogenase
LRTAETLKRQYSNLPIYPTADGRAKLSAAWLIEQCGWKGFRLDDAGVSAQHALVLLNHGQASGLALLTLAQRIQASVHETFSIGLEVEPTVI